ncbi:dienelactone hydrolase family protein [Rhizorhapis suberifaciens]|uniref:Dienelactone hydrolase n=1 Tax=Rhizorhapis suberifaciens TaxID=13656 RepID=A0A840HP45_9SPHN|nr:dienelactone hydrolase family protein [Rhizorhapis suberifaciens]MBB4639812.1 dienelactone hydrolase [Rhizorhapis suberifaciens]
MNNDPLPVEIGPSRLQALLGIPIRAKGLVIFAHGSGSGRHSPRNNQVAKGLRASGFATLLLDLLTPAEELDRHNIFDIPLLASRLATATAWVVQQPETAALRVGYFGASTGAGAALLATAAADGRIGAVVSRGGRPDLAGDALRQVHAPTLLIVGSLDGEVLRLNREALVKIDAPRRLAVVEGAGHLFEEPGTMDEVLDHAIEWFGQFLPRPRKETGNVRTS